MFKSFIAWLDAYISHEEPSSILKAIIGLLTFAGLLGTVVGNQAVRTGAFVVVIVFVTSAMLLLLADRRRLKRAYETNRSLLTRYCDVMIESCTGPAVSIETWQQDVYVHPNGDVKEVITIKAVALRERISFIRLTAGSRWDQPEKYRRGVKVTARSLTPTGDPGPRWNVTTPWISAQKMASILHLHEPIRRGEEVLFEMIRTWPAKCLPLLRGETEEFSIRASSFLVIQQATYSVVLPSGFDAAYELIGSTEPGAQLSTHTACDREGRKTFAWHAKNVPAWTRVGIRLELK